MYGIRSTEAIKKAETRGFVGEGNGERKEERGVYNSLANVSGRKAVHAEDSS